MKNTLSILAAMIAPFASLHANEPAPERPNVLFIAVDDLRPEMGCYGVDYIKTPNIDRLAATGSTFLNAYCNVPVCGASRASIMSSIRPITGKRFMKYTSRSDKEAPGITTLPEHFKNNGYTTISNGKVFHFIEDSAFAWSEKPWHAFKYDKDWAKGEQFSLHWKNPESAQNKSKKGRGPYWESADVPDSEHQDTKVADKTIADLKRLKETGKPFFLATGFWKPHLPCNAPKKYFDLYDRETLPMAENNFPVKGLPKDCKNSGEVNSYSRTKEDKKSGTFDRNLRHAYLACVSYIDAQIGRVLNTLEELELSDNTIVVLWGDHGWHLGEHTFWGKHNTLDNATRSPLIIKVPGITKGDKLNQLAEFVDVYPTLCALAGLDTPSHVQGQSLKPVLSDTSQPTKDAVFIAWNNCNTIKTEQFAYTEFVKKNKVVDRMLFNHAKDRAENVNVVKNPEYKTVVNELSQKLQNHLATVKGE